ncbi:MAG: type II toxin-antitoxin system RelE/ParE family toxin [Oscillospiraceae bacterium]|nr:type II toxin-antitoxin system RelE/ParE family toxin [Oscillospiraceae bacterium]
MRWKILYSARAKEDLESIYEYIAYDLYEPDTAADQVRAIMNAISNLDEMPMKYRQYDVEPWASKGMRIISVGNYVILYLPEENSNEVNIVRIMYGGRDIANQISEN